ncbi:heme ABC transporter permease [Bartonella tamiae]|uniref:Heme exporter protein C n=1 Tax=Bartonella tamiae Th239 TaxID=1094558 RepID=J1K1A3_9HYPH|nr:heme ABC transporter permease [Bartonella tamiae]EJF91232.1 heme exporter protein CcmC [Bartonella tamiae Th239]EJF93103.1 heme exporter protein CcmC [Bartonella tamiae Th307]
MDGTQNKPNWWQNLANPSRFMSLSKTAMPWLIAITSILLIVGLFFAFRAPADYQQGITVRIMYIHVPFAWLSMFCYIIMTASAFGTLVWRHPLADVALKSAAPIGAIFTALALITGSLWGRPTWGTWWEWDARLTSVLVLFFIYLAIIALSRAFDDVSKGAKASAILTLIGFINIPIIKFSVDWWNTLHQPASLIRSGGSAIDPSMLWPLLTMAIGFTFLLLTLHLASMRTEIIRRKVHNLQRMAARRLRNKERSL